MAMQKKPSSQSQTGNAPKGGKTPISKPTQSDQSKKSGRQGTQEGKDQSYNKGTSVNDFDAGVGL